jgi:hypothetical protein
MPIVMNKRPALHLRATDSQNKDQTEINYFDYIENGNSNGLPDGTKDNGANLLGKKRRKFDYIYDYLLMLGLNFYGKKNIDVVQRFWLDSKAVPEIKHRIKNLTCHKAPHNVIKTYKSLLETPLNQVTIPVKYRMSLKRS